MGEKKFKIQHWHIVAVMLMVYDTIVVNFAYAVALWLRFDCRFSAIDIKYLEAWIAYIPVRTVITLTVFWLTSMYKRIWRFLGIRELLPMTNATLIAGLINLCGITIFLQRMPISYYILGFVLEYVCVIGLRYSYLCHRTKPGTWQAGGQCHGYWSRCSRTDADARNPAVIQAQQHACEMFY